MAAPTIQFKRGAYSGITSFRAGEPAFTTDTFDFFIGLDNTLGNNKFFGSHRYWTRETGSAALNLNLVDKNGTNKISLKSPDTLSGITTYTLPETPLNTYLLTTNGSGVLSWTNAIPGGTLTGITTFTNTTDNTLGNADTGAVQIDGGLGVNKNLTVGANLNVQGYSEFVGVATFRGGTINIGDSNTDNINVGGEFISNLTPNDDNTYDIGIGTQRWRNASFSGVGTFATGAIIDAVQIGISAAAEIDTSSGALTLDSASGQTIIDDNLSVTGIATITGAFVANGNVTLGDAAGDIVTVNGTTTFTQPVVGTIGTATRATLVDTATAPTGTFYPGLFANNTGTASTAVYVDAGISYVSNTDTLTLTGDIAVNGGDVTTSATTFNLVNGTATNVNFAGAATALVIGAATGIATISNPTLTLPNATTVNINGANPTLASSSTGTLTAFNTNITKVNAFQAATDVVLSATTGITTVRNKLTVGGNLEVDGNNIQASDGNTNITLTSNTLTTFAGDIKVNGNDIQASDGNTNITMTSNTLTEVKGDLKVTGNDIQSSSATALTLSGADVTVAGDLQVTGNDIKSSTGAIAITLSANDVTIADDLTVSGNLYVNGSTTQVNTSALTVEDRTIDLGIVNGATPSSATTWDLGILFNYNSSGAKKSAVIWEHGDTRFKFASVIGSDTDGTDNNTPQLSVTTFAPIEIGSLWVTDCAGTSQVISCTGTTRNLENITIDCGQF
jgi:hypothetical protein